MVERERPLRRPLIPKWVLPASIAAGVVLLAIVGLTISSMIRSEVAVPDLVGVDEAVATVRLRQAHLEGEVVERPFDTAPEGTVLTQDPAPGVEIPEGSVVRITVSAGSEEFAMPDVVGLTVGIARGQLEGLGLVVKLEVVESDQPKDTVIATNPASGATVRTSDVVRVSVAGEPDSSALLPYKLDNLLFVVDPSPPVAGTTDVQSEVARRLVSLLKASGANVITTRSGIATGTTEAQRAEAVTGTVTAVVGLDALSTGDGGLAVTTLDKAAGGPAYPASSLLADELAKQLGADGVEVARATLAADTVLIKAGTAGARVRLGSTANAEDAVAFNDPTWMDDVARAIYRALGERFAVK